MFSIKTPYFLRQLVFDNIPISFVDSHKHLGATLSSTWQWHSHVENILNLKYSISINALNQMHAVCPICNLLLSIRLCLE